MTKLSASHLAILVSACSRDDALVVRPSDLKPAAAAKAASKLMELAFVREVRAKGEVPTWREDEDGRAYGLKILKAGRTAVRAMTASPATGGAVTTGSSGSAEFSSIADTGTQTTKTGTKRAVILALLNRDGGVTIDDLIAATGWLPHTTRAALSGLRKSGFAIVRTRDDGADASVYRIEAGTTVAAAAA